MYLKWSINLETRLRQHISVQSPDIGTGFGQPSHSHLVRVDADPAQVKGDVWRGRVPLPRPLRRRGAFAASAAPCGRAGVLLELSRVGRAHDDALRGHRAHCHRRLGDAVHHGLEGDLKDRSAGESGEMKF